MHCTSPMSKSCGPLGLASDLEIRCLVVPFSRESGCVLGYAGTKWACLGKGMIFFHFSLVSLLLLDPDSSVQTVLRHLGAACANTWGEKRVRSLPHEKGG
jgi:hypothetical protein